MFLFANIRTDHQCEASKRPNGQRPDCGALIYKRAMIANYEINREFQRKNGRDFHDCYSAVICYIPPAVEDGKSGKSGKTSMKRIRVGVIFGGRSGEHEVSLVSAHSVMNALDQSKYEVIPIGISKAGRWLVGGQSLRLLQNGEEPGR